VLGIAKRALETAQRERDRVVIFDTAGRLQIDEEMMGELKRLKAAIQPDEILFVADGMTGQEAVTIAEGFDKALDITGVVLTKMDGDARGGAALSIFGVSASRSSSSAWARSWTGWRTSTPSGWPAASCSRATC
jgi:signal recognition particle subunit SRP54